MNLVQLVSRTTDRADREVALQRANIAHAAFFLLRELTDRPGETEQQRATRFEKASRAATSALAALGVKDGFGLSDRRGNGDAKCLLWDVAEQAVALYLPNRTDVKRRDGATGFADRPVSDARAAELIADDIFIYGLLDASCIPLFGVAQESTRSTMRSGIVKYLETTRKVEADQLCGHALVAARLLTSKDRAAFFEVDLRRWKRERGYA